MVAFQLQAQISPGALHKSHAFLEGLTNCTQCHSAAAKTSPEKCLVCHTLLKARIDRGKGLHAQPGYQQCGDCHGDHYGREFELIRWKNGQENFDHSPTGFTLKGIHLELQCRDCHQPKFILNKSPLLAKQKDLKRTFLGVNAKCVSCHVDEHRGQFGSQCLVCHNMSGWKSEPEFDHDNTQFPLTGKHAFVDCEKCHTTVRDNKFADDFTFLKFDGLKFERCVDCHTDVHRGQFGKTCEKCHNTSGWSEVPANQFNHNKTRFPLRGKHKFVQCESCHKPGKPHRGVKFDYCSDCHSDFHRGQFLASSSRGACKECHTEKGFSPSTFTIQDHQQADFPLEGAHLAIACIACHAGGPQLGRSSRSMLKLNRFTIKATTCQDCHKDPHLGEVDKFKRIEGCQFCHRVESWAAIEFNHSQTNFELEGQHKKIACRDCHQPVDVATSTERLNFTDMPLICQDCHRDPHRGQFIVAVAINGRAARITDCQKCHTANRWQPDNFDHDRDSRFSLSGMHEMVSCKDCHFEVEENGMRFVKFKPLDTKCSACHGGDDW